MPHTPSALRRCITLSIAALAIGLIGPASALAQDAPAPAIAEDGSVPFPDDWYLRPGGTAVGWEMNVDAWREGRPAVGLGPRRDRPAFGADVLMQGSNVVVLRDSDGSIRNTGFLSDRPWDTVQETLYTYLPDEYDMIMVLTDWDERNVAAYYRPLANDTRGIGYQHFAGLQLFNVGDSDTLDGYIFMNNYRFYQGRNSVYGRIVFLQEIGHRWGAYVWYGGSDSDGTDMLGRDESHWSYFMHSETSGLEGNAWRDNDNGSFTTTTDAFSVGFSQLDRYLMGLLPPEEVDPWFLLLNPEVGSIRDDYGQRLNPASPPAFGGRVTLRADRYDISVDDVIRAEGNRSPEFESSQKVWRVATALIISQNSDFDANDLATVEDMLQEWEEIFEEEAGGGVDLILDINVDIPVDTKSPFGASCDASSDCDPASATTCVAADQGRVCSRECSSDADCGNFCCSNGFCFPNTDAACAEAPECASDADCGDGCCQEGACLDAADPVCGGDANNGGTNSGTTGTTGDTSNGTGGFVTDPGGSGFVNNGNNGNNDDCQAVAPHRRPTAPGAPWLLALGLIGAGAWLARRRRAPAR